MKVSQPTFISIPCEIYNVTYLHVAEVPSSSLAVYFCKLLSHCYKKGFSASIAQCFYASIFLFITEKHPPLMLPSPCLTVMMDLWGASRSLSFIHGKAKYRAYKNIHPLGCLNHFIPLTNQW